MARWELRWKRYMKIKFAKVWSKDRCFFFPSLCQCNFFSPICNLFLAVRPQRGSCGLILGSKWAPVYFGVRVATSHHKDHWEPASTGRMEWNSSIPLRIAQTSSYCWGRTSPSRLCRSCNWTPLPPGFWSIFFVTMVFLHQKSMTDIDPQKSQERHIWSPKWIR